MLLMEIDFLGIEKAWRSMCISIDTIFVKFIDWVYSIIIDISSARLITSSQVKGLTDRLFLLISVIMLFVVVYSLLRGIINPESATKGNFSGGKIVGNFVKSLALIILIPSAFDALYAVQNAALEENIIGRLITGAESSEVSDYKNLSHGMGSTLYFAFFQNNPNNPYPGYDEMVADVRDNNNWDRLKDDATLNAIGDGQIKYTMFLPVLSSFFVIYVLVLYCFDLGVRSIKLAFLQIISPIPAMMLMVPGQEKIFSSWLKTSISTFLEVFIKIAVLIFGFQIITFVNDPESGILSLFGDNPIANVFLILGIIAFINKAPKLISDIFGISSAGSLSIKDRWKDVKEGFNTISAPAQKVISTVGGYNYAMKAYRQGVASGNKDTKSRRARAAFHGMRKGFSGGISKMGEAYKYEMDNQYAYANKSDMSRNEYDIRRRDIENDQTLTLSQKRQKLSELRYQYLSSKDSFSAFSNSMRDNVGMVSLYEEAKFQAQVDRDNDNAPRRQQIALMDEAIFAADKDITRAESRHSTKKDVASKAKAIIDYAKTEVSKEKSKIKTNAAYELRDNNNNVLLSGETNAFAFEKFIYDIENNQNYTANEKADLIREAKDQIKALTNSYVSQQLTARSNNNIADMDSGFNRCVGDYLYAVDSAGTHLYNKVVDTDLHEESVFANLVGKVATDYFNNPIHNFKTDALSSVEKLRLVSDLLNQADDITKTSISNARATRTVTYFDKDRDTMVTSNIAEAKAIVKEHSDAISEKNKETEKHLESHNSDHK